MVEDKHEDNAPDQLAVATTLRTLLKFVEPTPNGTACGHADAVQFTDKANEYCGLHAPQRDIDVGVRH